MAIKNEPGRDPARARSRPRGELDHRDVVASRRDHARRRVVLYGFIDRQHHDATAPRRDETAPHPARNAGTRARGRDQPGDAFGHELVALVHQTLSNAS